MLLGLFVMTCAAAYQTWKQIRLQDFRTAAASNDPAPVAGPPQVEWALLRELNLKTGVAPRALASFEGRQVRIPGFAVPLEDNDNEVSEFLLVPYMGACVHTPPPPANQIVQVRTSDGKPIRVDPAEPVWVSGELRISPAKSRYGDASFQLRAILVEPYKEN